MTAADSYITEQASLRAKLLSLTAGFSADEVDDARQDLLLDYLRRSARFDQGRGEWAGFVRGVMRNQATVLFTRRHRRCGREILAGDVCGPDSDGANAFLEQLSFADPTDGFDLSLDVRRVLSRLPHDLRVLAVLLVQMTISEACIATGKSRSRVYQLIGQLRAAFLDAGLGPSSGCGK